MPKNHRPSPSPEKCDLGLERLVFFSDAVMAIAITLLAIDLRVPAMTHAQAVTDLAQRLIEMVPSLGSFLISFLVIGVYWMSHHRYFGYIERLDSRLMLLNMLFLLFIVLLPFSANLLGSYPDLPLADAVYALNVTCIGVAITGVWWYASRNHRLVDKQLDPHLIRDSLRRALIAPAIFVLSIPCAFVSPILAAFVWWLSPTASMVIARTGK